MIGELSTGVSAAYFGMGGPGTAGVLVFTEGDRVRTGSGQR
jgi:hypothetical protein